MANEDVIEKYRPEIHALADEFEAVMGEHAPGVIARAFLLAINRRALPEGMVFSLKRQPAVD